MNLEQVLMNAHAALERRYGQLKAISGQGIAKGQRVQFEENGRTVRCVIKTSAGGRISFGRRADGSWSGLSESDYVVIVAPTELHGENLMVSMFDQTTLQNAFEANHSAQVKAGIGHVPNWIAPFHEDGRGARGVGDGFGDKALWAESLHAISTLEATVSKTRRLSLQQAKEGLAQTFGVSPDAIEITIKG
jgi:hypothetical protein